MKLAIINQQDLPAPVVDAFTAINATIAGTFQVAHSQSGRTLRTLVAAYHNTTQNIPNATWSVVNFNAERDYRAVDGVRQVAGVHSQSVRSDRFLVLPPLAGLIRVSGTVVFAANATGSRGISLAVNGVLVRVLQFVPAATAVGGTVLSFSTEYVCGAQDEIGIQAYQNSGGALDIGSTDANAQNAVTIEFP